MKYFFLGLAIVLVLVLLFGCSAPPRASDCETHPSGWCSWDQSHLKAHDSGCPTAIYGTRGGVPYLCVLR